MNILYLILTLNLETKGTLPSSMSTSSFAYSRNSSARVVNSAFFLISASTNTNVYHVTSEPSLKKWMLKWQWKKGYKQIFIPVTVGLTKLVTDIQSPCFGSILGECRSLILSLSLFLSFKLYGAKQLIFTQGKKPHVTSDKLQDSTFKLPQVYCLVKWRAFFRALTESFNIVFSIEIALKILVLNANKRVKK